MSSDPQIRGANLDVLHNIESLLAYIELEFHILVSVNRCCRSQKLHLARFSIISA